MADSADKDSKTEEPTEKKIRDAVEKGQLPHSKEAAILTSFVAILIFTVFFAKDSALEMSAFLATFIEKPDAWPIETGVDVANLLGIVFSQVNYALSDRVLTQNCIDLEISPEDNGATGVCNIVEALQDPVTSGALFDPFYRLLPESAFNAQPRPSARDLEPSRQDLNPTGVVGTWLALDGKYPSTDRIGFADTTFPGNWPRILAQRVYGRNLSVAGEDGIYDTIDDRVLISGGGQDPRDQGGEASQPSAELLIVPKSPP